MNFFKRTSRILFLFLALATFCNGQRIFTTEMVNDSISSADKTLLSKRVTIEKNIHHLIAFDSIYRKSIPVVFHILESSRTKTIDNQVIYNQLALLNDAFSGNDQMDINKDEDINDYYANRATDIDIAFCLATIAPNGSRSTGIYRYQSSKDLWQSNNDMKIDSTGGIVAWDTDKYLNIWIVDMDQQVAGFAQYPGGIKETDGIVLNSHYLIGQNNSNYSLGKSLTHLAGNYLFLYPLSRSDCRIDFVDDTPSHDQSFYKCEASKIVNSCQTSQVAMHMNFMSNTFDSCSLMFTNGQKRRMHAVLHQSGPRASLSNHNLNQCN